MGSLLAGAGTVSDPRRVPSGYLREVLTAIGARLGSQVSWNALARDLSIDHPATVADYVDLLERMDAVLVQKALREDRLTGAPKKAKKLGFTGPARPRGLGGRVGGCGARPPAVPDLLHQGGGRGGRG